MTTYFLVGLPSPQVVMLATSLALHLQQQLLQLLHAKWRTIWLPTSFLLKRMHSLKPVRALMMTHSSACLELEERMLLMAEAQSVSRTTRRATSSCLMSLLPMEALLTEPMGLLPMERDTPMVMLLQTDMDPTLEWDLALLLQTEVMEALMGMPNPRQVKKSFWSGLFDSSSL